MLKVTDHALVRFLDRSGAAEIEALRLTLAHSLERARLGAQRAGIADYVIVADGLRYVVKDDALITVLDADMVQGRRRRRR
ncbi:hypothetical protein [Bosea vaviloviae]|uniref:Uncharacterized protein n=1 Tax=Bosea vaviloviae TaxID=1526658 RepID=A0A0N0MC15_9HYPH|nr:hypothetical protein [Bosea vaviloviae]KPH80537.1 hypothetical protein AE618_12220 [Bosea vaviloviae]